MYIIHSSHISLLCFPIPLPLLHTIPQILCILLLFLFLLWDPLGLTRDNRVGMGVELSTGTWVTHPWQHHWRPWFLPLQKPSVFSHSLRQGWTPWTFPPPVAECSWAQAWTDPTQKTTSSVSSLVPQPCPESSSLTPFLPIIFALTLLSTPSAVFPES